MGLDERDSMLVMYHGGLFRCAEALRGIFNRMDSKVLYSNEGIWPLQHSLGGAY